ncbi:phospholipase A [Campylobacter anatolicus]
MIKILAFLVVALNLMAQSADELYQKAQEYENLGDIKTAMSLYKQAAKKGLDSTQQKNKNSINLTQIPQPKTAQNQIAIKLASVQKATKESEQNPLGIKLYGLNYLLPATYTKNVANDERKKFETKFQFSIQKPLAYDIFGLKESIGVSYSQTSWWQTARTSAPFRESNYRPEIYVDFSTRQSLLNFNTTSIRLGLLHESNGQAGNESRSWNRLYAQGTFEFNKLKITPRIWAVVGDVSDNKAISEYVGRADVKLSYKLGGHIFNAILRNNLKLDKTNKGAFELGWLFPIFSNGIYGYLQYFNGYGENLFDYNKHTNKIGIGVAVLK